MRLSNVFTAPSGPATSPNYRWIVLVCAALSMAQGSINMSATIISLPDIAHGLGLKVATAIWVITGFQLVVTATASSFARLSDMYGREKVFTLGLALYIIAAILSGISDSGLQLIGSRMLLGAAYSISWANATPLVTDAFPPQQRGRALGLAVMAPTAGLMVGLVVGGIFTDVFDWRATYWLMMPLSVAVFAMSLLYLRETTERVPGQRLDIPGTVLWTSGLALLLVGLTFVTRAEWNTAKAQASFAAGAILLAAFFIVEPRIKQPMIDFSLFKNRVFASASAAAVTNLLGTSVIQLIISTFYFQGFKHYTPLETAVKLLPATLVFVLFSPLGGLLADRIGTRLPSLVGIAACFSGLLWLAMLDVHATYPEVLAAMSITQAGSALFAGPNTAAILTSAPASKRGMAGGIRGTTFNAGLAASSAMAVAIMATQIPQATLNTVLGGRSTLGPADADTLFTGFRLVFLTGAAFTAVAFATVFLRGAAKEATERPLAAFQPELFSDN